MKKLVSMRRSRSEREDGLETGQPAVMDDPFPWGLQLRLEREELDKLGLDRLPATGTELKLHARATVTSVEEREDEGGPSRSVGLQIEALAIAEDPETAADAIDAGIAEASS